ncbi:hypothetical protein B0H17DRAFT_1064314 [Mycena rosella]|uniref:O-fucosyltransferase family protein n=1 Tax=Mycena rosella TaxID=1033263 RepID=A0AAD7DG70_MYCRO|nr:hypothetical protein B0H17DRAFT_1064314 [Mycena rosella]
MSRFPTSVKGCDSPSVTMEKGRYRMRAPSTVPLADSSHLLKQPTLKHPRTRSRGGISSLMAALVVLLALACLASFGFAYYLFTMRWGATIPHTIPDPADPNIQVIPFNSFHRSPQYPASEKFISYLPHSGLHNQRIALENAIVLGALTNRTVLVPPIRLGSKPLRYVNSDSLQHTLAISGKTGLRHCSQIRTQFMPPECFDYFHYTHISPWWLFNLAPSNTSPPLIYLDDLSGLSMRRRLQLPISDILTLRDSTPYHYRFMDTMIDTTPLKHKYTEIVYIPDLAQYPHRLIELGTLFGSSRLRLRDRDNRQIRTQIRQRMEFSSPQLVEIADAIEMAIGAPYLGAHVRLGDGSFRANGGDNLRQVWWKLVHEILQFNISDTLRFERTFQMSTSTEPFKTSSSAANNSWPHFPLAHFSSGNLRCRGHRHPSAHMDRLNIPLFIATDVKNPTTDPSFLGFLRTFPCSFFLADFAAHTRGLDRLRNEYDGTAMRPFLLPLLDAMVVGRASVVAGTDGSTFSRFIQDVLWRRHHGLSIVERG